MVHINLEQVVEGTAIRAESGPVPLITFVVLISEPVVEVIDLSSVRHSQLRIVLPYDFNSFPAICLLIRLHIHRIVMV